MAVKKEFPNEAEEMQADLTVAVPKAKEKYTGPMVSVFLPEIEGGETEGVKIDQYEHVTIANEHGEKIWQIRRGQHVEVPVPVYMVLKEKYPKI